MTKKKGTKASAATATAATAIGVRNVPTKSLKPNPHNPRALFDRADLVVLKDSIAHVGILVPLTVYREGRSRVYRILDGQRRWMCADELNLPTVPVNEVAEPTLVQNIVTMFQIHKLRKDWELMPTALKLELLMSEVKDRNEKRIAALTGLDPAVVARCKKLLSFPRKYQDMMLVFDPEKRLKADFFIELYAVTSDRTVKEFSWFEPNAFTDAMLKKQEAKGLKAVTEFRVVKQRINNAVKAKQVAAISARLKEFAETPSLGVDHLNIESAEVSSESRRLAKSAQALLEHIKAIDVDDFYGEDDLWKQLDDLAKLIRAKLKALGRRAEE